MTLISILGVIRVTPFPACDLALFRLWRVKITINAVEEILAVFIDELMPILRELSQQPLAFLGGFASGVLKLNLADDPVKSWLDQQIAKTASASGDGQVHNGKNGPQSISID